MPLLDFPQNPTEGQEWEDNDGVIWLFWRGSWVQVGGNVATGTVPTGMVAPYGGVVAPEDWLLCDGAAVSRTEYEDLYAIIGNTYGAGDGSTTFNVPNLTQTVPAGASGTHPPGDEAGADTITLAVGQMPEHAHSLTIDAVGNHTHGGNTTNNGIHGHSGSTGTGGAHSHTVAVRPLNQAGGGSNTWTHSSGSTTTSQHNGHNHSVTIFNSGEHNHGLSVSGGGGHTHTGSASPTGSGAAIDIRQATLYMYFIIKT